MGSVEMGCGQRPDIPPPATARSWWPVSVCVPLIIEANCDKEADRATPEGAMKATNTIW